MNKHKIVIRNAKAKLRVARETITHLSARQMENVLGGGPTSNALSCTADECNPTVSM